MRQGGGANRIEVLLGSIDREERSLVFLDQLGRDEKDDIKAWR